MQQLEGWCTPRHPGARCQQGGSAAPGRGMQRNLLDLSEWPQIEQRPRAWCKSHALSMALASSSSSGAPCLDAYRYKPVPHKWFTFSQPDAMQSSGEGWVLKILGRWPVEWNAKPIQVTEALQRPAINLHRASQKPAAGTDLTCPSSLEVNAIPQDFRGSPLPTHLLVSDMRGSEH